LLKLINLLLVFSWSCFLLHCKGNLWVLMQTTYKIQNVCFDQGFKLQRVVFDFAEQSFCAFYIVLFILTMTVSTTSNIFNCFSRPPLSEGISTVCFADACSLSKYFHFHCSGIKCNTWALIF
jgi:hypothetical protein